MDPIPLKPVVFSADDAAYVMKLHRHGRSLEFIAERVGRNPAEVEQCIAAHLQAEKDAAEARSAAPVPANPQEHQSIPGLPDGVGFAFMDLVAKYQAMGEGLKLLSAIIGQGLTKEDLEAVIKAKLLGVDCTVEASEAGIVAKVLAGHLYAEFAFIKKPEIKFESEPKTPESGPG